MVVNPNFTDKAKRDYDLIRLALDKKDRNAYADLWGITEILFILCC
jgi:hypothetical protein